MTRLRVGLVGAGMVAAHHIAAWSRCPNADLVAVADPDVAAAARRSGPGVSVHRSLSDLLARARVDAIDIAAPVSTHAALVEEGVSAGLPVLCQKPLAPTAAQAEALVAGLPSDARVMLHENWRWRPSYREMRARIAGGGLPEDFELKVESSGLCPATDGTYPALVRQPFLAELERLIVFELLGHHMDVLSFLFGPLEVIAARTMRRTLAVRGEDFAEIDLLAGGVRGRLIGDFVRPDAPPRPRDTMWLNGREILSDWRLTLSGDEKSWAHEAGYQNSYDACIRHFSECVASEAAFETPVTHGITLLRHVEEVYRIARFQDLTS